MSKFTIALTGGGTIHEHSAEISGGGTTHPHKIRVKDSPKNIQEIVASGRAPEYFAIGDVIRIPWVDRSGSDPVSYGYPFVVAHFGTVYDPAGKMHKNAVCLMAKVTAPRAVPFDVPEETGVDLTTETHALDGWNYWTKATGGAYTALNLNPGEEIPTPGASATVVKCGINRIDVVKYGYNRWKMSAIRQWLNSDAAKSAGWWTSQHIGDVAPSSAVRYSPGWMDGFTAAWKAIFKPVAVTTRHKVSSTEIITDTTFDTFFLPSKEELYGPSLVYGSEGEAWQYMKEAVSSAEPTSSAASGRIFCEADNDTTATAVQTRTGDPMSNECDIFAVTTTGAFSAYPANITTDKPLPCTVIY